MYASSVCLFEKCRLALRHPVEKHHLLIYNFSFLEDRSVVKYLHVCFKNWMHMLYYVEEIGRGRGIEEAAPHVKFIHYC